VARLGGAVPWLGRALPWLGRAVRCGGVVRQGGRGGRESAVPKGWVGREWR
jgi:hypothetical protein